MFICDIKHGELEGLIQRNPKNAREKPFLTHLTPILHFYTPLKTSENQRFCDVFRGYKNETLA